VPRKSGGACKCERLFFYVLKGVLYKLYSHSVCDDNRSFTFSGAITFSLSPKDKHHSVSIEVGYGFGMET